jgi:DNA-binding response OmpR family regulator
LPATSTSAAASTLAPRVDEPEAQTGTVLLVEDDAAVRDFVGEVLRSSGWTVVVATTPSEALAVAARQTLVLDVLVTDVVMPGMNGGELADRLVELRPQLRVLFITGYDDEEVASRGLTTKGREMLAKPFTPGQLRARIRLLVAAGARP